MFATLVFGNNRYVGINVYNFAEEIIQKYRTPGFNVGIEVGKPISKANPDDLLFYAATLANEIDAVRVW